MLKFVKKHGSYCPK